MESYVTDEAIQKIPELLLANLDVGWTLLLLMTRFTALVMVMPGIGGGLGGLAVRYPAIVLLAFAAIGTVKPTPVPPDIAVMMAQFLSEFVLGCAVATVPLLLVTSAAMAGQIASNSIGLNGAQMFDPTTSTPMSDLSRIYSDLTVLLFLLMNGHHVVIGHVAGLGKEIQPGQFFLSAPGVESLIVVTAHVFEFGVMIAAPVIVALLLVNFVMGLLSKMVPSFNVFMMTFYITIAIGFGLSFLALPELVAYMGRRMMQLDPLILAVIQ
jgi:flagellar biosynthetic protein FliR